MSIDIKLKPFLFLVETQHFVFADATDQIFPVEDITFDLYHSLEHEGFHFLPASLDGDIDTEPRVPGLLRKTSGGSLELKIGRTPTPTVKFQGWLSVLVSM